MPNKKNEKLNGEVSAVLFHRVGWLSQLTEFDLEGGIKICRTDGSNVERLYHELCENKNVDQGEPFDFPAYLLIPESAHDDSWPYWGGPASIISECCNFIVLCASKPLGLCRLIYTTDGFKTASRSTIIYEDSETIDSLTEVLDVKAYEKDGSIIYTGSEYVGLDDDKLQEIAACFSTFKMLQKDVKISHRVTNALDYYFYSWRSYYMEHVFINLSIVLESLFSPRSEHELSHQIAFNASHFLGKNAGEKEDIYETIKRFYGLRSRIVHGGHVKFQKLHILGPKVFKLCGEILKLILIDHAIALRFSNEKDREVLFREWLFER